MFVVPARSASFPSDFLLISAPRLHGYTSTPLGYIGVNRLLVLHQQINKSFALIIVQCIVTLTSITTLLFRTAYQIAQATEHTPLWLRSVYVDYYTPYALCNSYAVCTLKDSLLTCEHKTHRGDLNEYRLPSFLKSFKVR